jgi:hypothetical protein
LGAIALILLFIFTRKSGDDLRKKAGISGKRAGLAERSSGLSRFIPMSDLNLWGILHQQCPGIDL